MVIVYVVMFKSKVHAGKRGLQCVFIITLCVYCFIAFTLYVTSGKVLWSVL